MRAECFSTDPSRWNKRTGSFYAMRDLVIVGVNRFEKGTPVDKMWFEDDMPRSHHTPLQFAAKLPWSL